MASSSWPTCRWRRPRAAERRSAALCGSGRVAAPIPSECCGARGIQRKEKERHSVFVGKQVRAGLVEPGPKRTLVRARGMEDSCLCPRRVRRVAREREQVSAATDNRAADRRQEDPFFSCRAEGCSSKRARAEGNRHVQVFQVGKPGHARTPRGRLRRRPRSWWAALSDGARRREHAREPREQGCGGRALLSLGPVAGA